MHFENLNLYIACVLSWIETWPANLKRRISWPLYLESLRYATTDKKRRLGCADYHTYTEICSFNLPLSYKHVIISVGKAALLAKLLCAVPIQYKAAS